MNRKQRRATRDDTADGIRALLAQGLEHHRQGKLHEAEASYRRVLKKQPANADALHLTGLVALQSGRHARAVDRIGKAVRHNGSVPRYHYNLALALIALGRTTEAVAGFRRAVELDPGYVDGWASLGNALAENGEPADARTAAERALALDPDHVDAITLLGRLCAESSDSAAAIGHFRRAVELDPESSAAQNNLGGVLLREDDAPGAIGAFRRAAALDPHAAEPRVSLGHLLYLEERPEEAEEALRAALQIEDDNANAWLYLAQTLRALGRETEALTSIERAVTADPGFDSAIFNRGLVHLAQGRFESGWRDYQRRRSVNSIRERITQEPLAGTLEGKRILVHRDQGLGDEIFFLRFVRSLKERRPAITYSCDSKIISMVARLGFIDDLIDAGSDGDAVPEPPGIDIALSAGDLPHMLGLDTADRIPPSIEIPLPDASMAEARTLLSSMGPPPYIGLTWRAGTQRRSKLSKVGPLEGIAGALQNTDGTLVALQRNPTPGEIDRFAEIAGRPVHDASALNEDLERMLAVLDTLDDYICMSNTNLHLRAARGRTSRVLVPLPAEFRWMAEGTESPWFPGSPVYREDPAEGWGPALARLAGDLTSG